MKSKKISANRTGPTGKTKMNGHFTDTGSSQRVGSSMKQYFYLQRMIGNAAARSFFQNGHVQKIGFEKNYDIPKTVQRDLELSSADKETQKTRMQSEWVEMQPEEEEEEPVKAKHIQRQSEEESEEQKPADPGIRSKLTVGNPGDVYEQEADIVAEQVSAHYNAGVMNDIQKEFLSTANVSTILGIINTVRSPIFPKAIGGARKQRIFPNGQGSGDQEVPSIIEGKILQSKGKGSPLPPMVQNIVSLQTGYDFSNVRVKTDSEAGDLNRSLNARAFTHGSDIWLGKNESISDVKLMSHELTHVVQQGAAKKISPKTISGFGNTKEESNVKRYLQTLISGGNQFPLQFHEDIAKFKLENSYTKIDRLQQQILEQPKSADIAQKSNSQIMRFCAGCTPAPPSAVPRNFRKTAGSDAGGGILHFEYAWDSSSGNLVDLRNCEVGERVDYTQTENPPYSPAPNPTIIWLPGRDGALQDNHSPGVVKPYKASTERATQYYRYRCSGGSPVNLMGPISIVREVISKPDGSYKYRITKSGISAEIDPLP